MIADKAFLGGVEVDLYLGSVLLTSAGGAFNFNLTAPAKTSAGVYKNDGTDDILIRTLWSGEKKQAGAIPFYWDGKLDDGITYAPDGNYKIKMLSNNVTYTPEGLIGNTSNHYEGSTLRHPANPHVGMCILANTAYLTNNYNENAQCHPKFNLSEPNELTTSLNDVGGWWRYIATDGIGKVFYAGVPDGFLSAVTAIDANPTGEDVISDLTDAPFQNVSIQHYHYDVFDGSGSSAPTGLAVSGNYVFVAHADVNQVRVFTKTGGTVRTITGITNPRECSIVGTTMWILTGANSLQKFTINNDGTLSAALLTISGLIDPLCTSISPDGSMVAVSDRISFAGGVVKIYNSSTGSLIRTIGRSESYTVSSTVYDDKFYFNNTVEFNETNYGTSKAYLCFQDNTNLWIGDYGNRRSQKFNVSTGAYVSNFQSLGYQYACQVDANDATRMFSDYLEFQIDYSKQLVPNNGSWKFVNNWSALVAGNHSSNDGRMESVATLSNGRTYFLDLLGDLDGRAVVELMPGGVLRYTGIQLESYKCKMQPDGSIWKVDDVINGQSITWSRKPLINFDSNHNPVWGDYVSIDNLSTLTDNDPISFAGFARMQTTTSGIMATFNTNTPSLPFDQSVKDTDTNADTYSSGNGYHLGGRKNGKWIFKTAYRTHHSYNGTWPEDGSYEVGGGIHNGGTFMQAVDRNIFWGDKGEYWHGIQCNKYAHYYDNGLFLNHFGMDGQTKSLLGIESPLGYAGNANSGTYVKAGNDIYFYHADEGQHAAPTRWKISHLDSIQEQTINIVKSGTPTPPAVNYVDIMAGLPYNQSLANNTAGWTRSTVSDYQNPTGNDRWEVRTNRQTYTAIQKNNKDVTVVWFPNVTGSSHIVTKDLGTNNTASWKIEGKIAWMEGSERGINAFDILDVNGRIIARINKDESFPTTRITANGTLLANGLSGIFGLVHIWLRPFTISVNGSTVSVIYHDYPTITSTVFDALADATKPKTIRLLMQNNTGDNSGHQVSVANLKFYNT